MSSIHHRKWMTRQRWDGKHHERLMLVLRQSHLHSLTRHWLDQQNILCIKARLNEQHRARRYAEARRINGLIRKAHRELNIIQNLLWPPESLT